MKNLSAAADGQVHHSPGTGAGFRTEVAGGNAKFAQRIGVDVDEIVAAPAVVFVIRAVQIPGSGVAPPAVDGLAAVIHAVTTKQPETALVGG